MTLVQFHPLPYEQPRSAVFEITPQGVLCQSPVDTQNLENPSAPTTADHTW